MARRIVWSSRAVADVDAIAAYIAQDSPAYANIVVKKIVKLTRQLSRFPQSGRVVPEFRENSLRELLVYSYRIIYKIEEREITIGQRDSWQARFDLTSRRWQRSACIGKNEESYRG